MGCELMKRKIIFCFIIFTLFLTISAISANENTTFDSSASTIGAFYLSNISTETTVPTEGEEELGDEVNIDTITCGEITLRQWEPIGENGSFRGIFNGNNNNISGLFLLQDDDSYTGLFAYCTNASIE